jgi:hypothetical protein
MTNGSHPQGKKVSTKSTGGSEKSDRKISAKTTGK